MSAHAQTQFVSWHIFCFWRADSLKRRQCSHIVTDPFNLSVRKALPSSSSAMSAKRQKVDHFLLAQASTGETDDEFPPVKSEDDELPREQVEHYDEDDDEDRELPPYHEFHHFRNLRSMARRLMKYSGLDLERFQIGRSLLKAFVQRYHCLEKAQAFAAYFKFSLEQSQNGTWSRYTCRATLTAYTLNERQFKGDWCVNEHLAEKSAINAFREDPEILEIAQLLPPIMKRVRENLRLSKAEKSSMEAAGIEPLDVLNALVHTVYMILHVFPRLGV